MADIKKSNAGGRTKQYTEVSKGKISLPNNDVITRAMLQDGVVNNDKLDSGVKKYISTKNLLLNGDMNVWQLGTAFTAATTPANSDDTYLADQWILLSEGNDIVDVSASTDAPTNSKYAMKFLVATINKKFGIFQPLEGIDCYKLANGAVSLSFQAKTTAAKVINNIRAAVVSWDSTEDTITSDIVDDWEVSGDNPTLVANWTYENVATNLALTTSYQTFTIENIQIDTASMKNVGLFIWCDDTDAALNDELFIGQVGLFQGPDVFEFTSREDTYAKELAACQRYLEKLTLLKFVGYTDNAADIAHMWNFAVTKRAAPAVTNGGTFALIGASAIAYQQQSINGVAIVLTRTGAAMSGIYSNADGYVVAKSQL